MVELGPMKKRLLVVDDDESLRELFRFAMEKEGFAVQEACDGVEGLQKTPEFEPDVLVVDLMMPNLGGFEMIRNLQALGFGRIPVVVITAFSDQSGEEMVRQEPNVVEFVKKPIDYGALAAFIRGRLK